MSPLELRRCRQRLTLVPLFDIETVILTLRNYITFLYIKHELRRLKNETFSDLRRPLGLLEWRFFLKNERQYLIKKRASIYADAL